MIGVSADCNKIRVVRAFTVMALIMTAISFIPAWLGYNSRSDIIYRGISFLCNIAAAAFGIIAWAVFLSVPQVGLPGGEWSYSWAMGLMIGAWLLNIGIILSSVLPYPVQDLGTQKAIGEQTLHGRGMWR